MSQAELERLIELLYTSHRDEARVKFEGSKEQWLARYGNDLKFLGFLASRLRDGLASGWSREELNKNYTYFTLKDHGWTDNFLNHVPAFALFGQHLKNDSDIHELQDAMEKLAPLKALS